MNILNKLTKKNLLLNKKRTIVTIIGIVLSVALIVCVSGMVTSFQKTIVNATILDSGNYHVLIKDMNREEITTLENNRNIKEYFLMENLGYAKVNNENEYKPYLYITAYNEKALNNMAIKLIDGKMPKQEDEIVIPTTLLEDKQFNKQIGDEITLDIGLRTLKDENGEKYYLNQNNPYTIDEENIELENREELEIKSTKTFKIVGVIERINYTLEPYSAPGYTCITYLDHIDNNIDAAILYQNPKNYKTKTKEIVNDKYDYTYNSELLRWLGVTNSNTMNALYTVSLVVISIIIISSVFVIRNSFAISITEKYKMYGMLRSIGATSKQIKHNVLYEGFILGLIAIPLGILCGILAVIILIFLINFILGDYLNNFIFVYSIPIVPILLSIILSSITIYLSVIFTAKKASKISAIEAIRSNQDIKIKSKKLKTPKIIEKLFKTGGVIAYKNLKRNKKKYRTTVISLVVSIFVFLSLSSFIDLGFKMSGNYYKELGYNISVNPSYDLDEKTKEKIIKELTNVDGVKEFSIHRYGNFNLNTNDYLSLFGKKIKEIYEDSENETNKNIMVLALGEEEYSRYLKENNLIKKDNLGILIDEYSEIINGKTTTDHLYDIKNNTILNGTVNKMVNEKEVKTNLELEIISSDIKPMGLEYYYVPNGVIIISDELYNKYFAESNTAYTIYINAKDASKVEEKIKEMNKENNNYKITCENIDEYVKENNAMVLIISIFLYGFIFVITLIGITNIFNTITTNMNLRSKEFAMLKSIGMTKKEFNHMIRLESIFYGLKSLLIGIPLGLLGSYLIYLAFKEGMEFAYIFPLKYLIIVIIFVSFIIGIIMRYSLKKINKQNIIETIRNDNI